MKKYKLTVNKDQLWTINSALEILSRLHSGQWEGMFDYVFRMKCNKYKNCYKKMDKRFSLQEMANLAKNHRTFHKGTFYYLLNVLKEILLELEPGEGIGIGQERAENEMNTAFDIKQVTRTELGDTRTPFRHDKENELPEIEVCE